MCSGPGAVGQRGQLRGVLPGELAGQACPGARRWPSAGRAGGAGRHRGTRGKSSATQRRCPARSAARHSAHGVGAAQASSLNWAASSQIDGHRRRRKPPALGRVPNRGHRLPPESVRPIGPSPLPAACAGARAPRVARVPESPALRHPSVAPDVITPTRTGLRARVTNRRSVTAGAAGGKPDDSHANPRLASGKCPPQLRSRRQPCSDAGTSRWRHCGVPASICGPIPGSWPHHAGGGLPGGGGRDPHPAADQVIIDGAIAQHRRELLRAARPGRDRARRRPRRR